MADVQVNDEEMSSSPLASTEAPEPTEVEHDTTAIVAAPDQGSLPLISEHGNPRFPRVLLDGGGYEILGMPINKGLPVWVTSVIGGSHDGSSVMLNLGWLRCFSFGQW